MCCLESGHWSSALTTKYTKRTILCQPNKTIICKGHPLMSPFLLLQSCIFLFAYLQQESSKGTGNKEGEAVRGRREKKKRRKGAKGLRRGGR